MSRSRALAAAALILLGLLALTAAAPAKKPAKLYSVAVSSAAKESVLASASESDETNDCKNQQKSTDTAAFSATLTTPKHPAAAPLHFRRGKLDQFLSIHLKGARAHWHFVSTGSSTPKFPDSTCSFDPANASGDCRPNGVVTSKVGVPFDLASDSKGRLLLRQASDTGGLFGVGDSECRAEQTAGGGQSGGFLDRVGITTKVKLSTVKALGVGHKAKASGTATAKLTEPYQGTGRRTITVIAHYTLTVTRKR